MKYKFKKTFPTQNTVNLGAQFPTILSVIGRPASTPPAAAARLSVAKRNGSDVSTQGGSAA